SPALQGGAHPRRRPHPSRKSCQTVHALHLAPHSTFHSLISPGVSRRPLWLSRVKGLPPHRARERPSGENARAMTKVCFSSPSDRRSFPVLPSQSLMVEFTSRPPQPVALPLALVKSTTSCVIVTVARVLSSAPNASRRTW